MDTPNGEGGDSLTLRKERRKKRQRGVLWTGAPTITCAHRLWAGHPISASMVTPLLPPHSNSMSHISVCIKQCHQVERHDYWNQRHFIWLVEWLESYLPTTPQGQILCCRFSTSMQRLEDDLSVIPAQKHAFIVWSREQKDPNNSISCHSPTFPPLEIFSAFPFM